MGTYGALKYDQARSRGASRGKAAVNAILGKKLNELTDGWASVVEPRVSAVLKEKKSKKKKK